MFISLHDNPFLKTCVFQFFIHNKQPPLKWSWLYYSKGMLSFLLEEQKITAHEGR